MTDQPHPPSDPRPPYGQDPYAPGPQNYPAYGAHPYGPGPYGAGQPHYGAQPYDGAQPYGPPGQFGPPAAPARRRRGHPDSEPGRFMWWDLGAFLLYVLGFLAGGIGLILGLTPLGEMAFSGDPVEENRALFLLQGISYGILGATALALSGAALWRSIKAFAYLWWLKLLLIPAAWIATVVINAVITMTLTDEPEVSQNQLALEEMLTAVPFVAAVVVIAMLGPYVEEYFFRHLMIGKLSRFLNIWICGLISIITFPLLHFIPALIGLSDDLSLVTVVPYVTMGLVFTLAYILTGRSLLYAWLLHAFNNFMSLVMVYFVVPRLDNFLEESGIDPQNGLISGLLDSSLATAGGLLGLLCPEMAAVIPDRISGR